MADPPTVQPLLSLSPERRAKERKYAEETEAAVRWNERRVRRVFWQCVALAFAGVPIYLWSWHLTNQRLAEVVTATAFFVTYGLPFFRWLSFYISRSEAYD